MSNIYDKIIKVLDAVALVNGKKENITWLTSETGKHYAVNENGERVVGDQRATGGTKKIINRERSKEKVLKTIQKAGQQYKDDEGNIINTHGEKLYGKDKIVKQSEKDVYNKMKPSLKVVYDKSIENEEENTKQLDSLAKKFNLKLVGENSSLKMPSSLMRKLNKDYEESDGTKSKEQILKNLFDVNRYTMVAGPEHIVERANEVLKYFVDNGYKINKAKNGWLVPDEKNYYNGFNCQIISPNGSKFELQFHTLNSFETKEFRTHKYYEIERDDKNYSEDERKEATRIAYNIVKEAKDHGGLKTPKNVENFANFS